MKFPEDRKNLLIWWIAITLLAAFCLYWENRLYFYLSSWVDRQPAGVPYDPLFYLLPAINFYGLIKLGLPLTFLFFLIGWLLKIYRLPYLLFMNGFWWIGRWLLMISVIFGVPPDRPTGLSGFFLSDWLNQVIPNGILTYGQTFMFSGHVGLPFLYACLFYSKTYPFLSKKWFKENWLSIIFFSWSLVQAIIAIFSRSHYTIDVVVAYLATICFFKLGCWIFRPIECLGEKLKSAWNGSK